MDIYEIAPGVVKRYYMLEHVTQFIAITPSKVLLSRCYRLQVARNQYAHGGDLSIQLQTRPSSSRPTLDGQLKQWSKCMKGYTCEEMAADVFLGDGVARS